jgi:hypothetical protein
MTSQTTATAVPVAVPRRLSGVWLILRRTRGDQQFLAVNPGYDARSGQLVPGGTGRYQLVGGACAGGEAPHEAAVRHGRAEIGLEMKPDTHLLADYMPPNPQASSTEGVNHVWLHQMRSGEEINLNAGDKSAGLADFRWFAERDLDGACFTDYQARRIRLALQAAADPAHRGYAVRGRKI